MSEHPMYYQSDRELAFSKALRARCVEEMDRIGDLESQKKLSLLPGGIESIRWNTNWGTEKAVRVAILLDLPVMQALERCVTA